MMQIAASDCPSFPNFDRFSSFARIHGKGQIVLYGLREVMLSSGLSVGASLASSAAACGALAICLNFELSVEHVCSVLASLPAFTRSKVVGMQRQQLGCRDSSKTVAGTASYFAPLLPAAAAATDNRRLSTTSLASRRAS